MARIFIIDDEPAAADWVSNFCRNRGHQPFHYSSPEAAIDALPHIVPQLVLADLKTAKPNGLDFLGECKSKQPHTIVVMVAASDSVEQGLKAIQSGAFDYITKPFKVDELEGCIQRSLEHHTALCQSDIFRHATREQYKFEDLIGTSPKMQSIYRLIGKVADTESTILIQGESGTGKELVARALHYNSSRQHHPFVSINCSALPDNLLESELFGHKKGAFAGAVTDKIGLFEEANHGTLFFDEINSMSLQLQTKLLRVLQERQIRRIGDTRNIPINVRAIAASVEPLKNKIRTAGFREDLYYRLAVIPIEIPPLRDRIEDIPLLTQYFLQRYALQSVT